MKEFYARLRPLAYQVELRDYLKAQERELWDWFASARAQADYTANLRMQLLKSTYRLDAESHPELYQGVAEAKEKLRLDIPVTLYQAQGGQEPNATLYYIPAEGHVVFSGPVLTLLSAAEIKSVLGHELAHYHLWQWEGGDLHITDRLIQAVANDPRAAASHEHTARRFQLYTEIFADRGSLCVTGDVLPVVSGLVKIHTGLGQASASAYLKQAAEIFARENPTTEGGSHPESFIRARALELWEAHADEAAPEIARMIEGPPALDDLDLIGQARQAKNTRRLLEYFLQPKWFRTPAVLAHAKLFFADFQPAGQRNDSELAEFKFNEAKLGEYLCYILMDFVRADPELEDMPLAAALALTRALDLEAPFEKIATKELKMKVRDVRKLKDEAAGLLARAEAGT